MSPQSRALWCSAEGRNPKCWGVYPPHLDPGPSRTSCACCSKKCHREGQDEDQPPNSQDVLAHLGFVLGSGRGGVPPEAPSRYPSLAPPTLALIGGRLFPADLHGRCRPAERFCSPGPPSPAKRVCLPPPCEKRLPVPSFPMKKRRSLRIA